MEFLVVDSPFILAHKNNKKVVVVKTSKIIRTALASSHTMAHGAEEGVVLILTRKVGETLVIGDEVEVTVLSMKGNQIRLGVKAPKESERLAHSLTSVREFSSNRPSVLQRGSMHGCVVNPA